jgi:DNA-directed RNA polymerase subunit RPC12/RpoP
MPIHCPHCGHDLTPHEIGTLYAALGRTRNSTPRRFWGAKLTTQDVNRIHKSKAPIKDIAEKYNVSFSTIWRAKENRTHTSQKELNCPYCGQKLTPKQIGRLFASLGGSTRSPRKAQTAAGNVRKRAKLTEKDVVDIRKSNAPTRELMKKYKVSRTTINETRRKKQWSSILD